MRTVSRVIRRTFRSPWARRAPLATGTRRPRDSLVKRHATSPSAQALSVQQAATNAIRAALGVASHSARAATAAIVAAAIPSAITTDAETGGSHAIVAPIL